MEFTVKTELDMSGFKTIEKFFKLLGSKVAHSGVIKADERTMQAALLNEFGGTTTYSDGPFAGEEVQVPPRSFVRSPAELNAKEIFKKAEDVLKQGFTENNANEAIATLGHETAKKQRDALENNGSGIPGWLQHNEERTIATKGFDKPLWSRRNETFPIDFEVVEK